MAQLNDLLVLGNSNLLGDANIFGTLGIYDNLNINGNVSIGGTLSVAEAATFNKNVGIIGNLSTNGTLAVVGISTLTGKLTANGGIATTSITASGSVAITQHLAVSGNTNLGGENSDEINIIGKTTITGPVAITGDTKHNGVVYFANGTTYYINNSATGNLNALTLNNTTDSSATTNGALIVKGGVGIAKQLRVAGNTTLSGTLSVTGTSSFHNLMTISYGDKKGIKLGGAYITCCVDTGEVVLQGGHLRFGSSAWDYNTWAGLKYIHTDSNNALIKTIYLGLAENNIFTANAPQSEGTLSLPGIRYFVINGKTVIDAGDAWLRINQGNAHSSGVYFGTSITRTDGRLEVGDSGNKFYANNLGNGYFRNTLRIGAIGSNTSLDGNWCEGIRINAPAGQWATIIIGSTGETGTNENAWSLHRTNSNDFNISHNSCDGINGLVIKKDTGNVGIGTASPSYRLHVNGTGCFESLLVQGSPSADSTIASMNRFQSDLFVQGNGSAPNTPRVAGFYLGKSQSDENRHMDIVSGADYSYIDFNKASTVEDYKVRLIVNVSDGLTEFQWGSGATNPRLNINGIGNFSGHLYANNGLTWTNAYWTAPGNIICNKNSAGSEFSFDMGAGTQWHVWSTKNGTSILSCFSDNNYVQAHHHLQVGNYNNSSYALTTDSFICNSWIRTMGKTGWFNEEYGGGWYMEDTTYVRAYNNKQVYVSNTGQHAIYTAGGFASATTSGAVFSTYYNGTWYDTLRTHGNGNLTVDAPGGSLYLAYYRGNTYFAGGTYYIDRNGYFNGGTAYLVRQSSISLDGTGADNLFSDGKLQWAAVDPSTYGNDGSIISLGWNSSYGSQIWVDDGGGSGGMAVRSRNGSGWNPWKTLIKSNSATYYGAGDPPTTGASTGDVYFKYI